MPSALMQVFSGGEWAPWDGAVTFTGDVTVSDINTLGSITDPVTVETAPGVFVVSLGINTGVDIGNVGIKAGQSVALAAGAASIGTLGANAGVDIGNVGIKAAQTLANVTTVAAVTAVTDVTNPVGLKAIQTTGPNVFENLRSATAANMGGPNSSFAGGAVLTGRAGEWITFSDPGAATLATATKIAGGAGKTHVITSISACVYMPNAQTGLTLRLIDGNSGGTVIASWKFPLSATAQGREFIMTGLNIVMPTTNGPVTLEFNTAPAAGNFESVTMTGYTTG